MEIILSDKIPFAYTVKILGNRGSEPTTYQPFFDKLNKFDITIEEKEHEYDSKGKLHYHGIIHLVKGFYRKRLTTPGFSVKLEELYDKEGWIKYINKDKANEHQLMYEEYKETTFKPTKSLFVY